MTRVETSAGPARRLRRIQPMGSVARYEMRIGEMAQTHAGLPA